MKHKQQAIAALEKDCEITGTFTRKQPDGTYKYCGTGCLAVVAGCEPESLLPENSDGEEVLDQIGYVKTL